MSLVEKILRSALVILDFHEDRIEITLAENKQNPIKVLYKDMSVLEAFYLKQLTHKTCVLDTEESQEKGSLQ